MAKELFFEFLLWNWFMYVHVPSEIICFIELGHHSTKEICRMMLRLLGLD